MTEEALRSYAILWGVEAVAPQFGTSIAVFKNWMRGDSALPDHVWNAWVAFSGRPTEEQRPGGVAAQPASAAAMENAGPGTMKQSSLANKIFADPAIAARIKAETQRPLPTSGSVVMEAPVVGRNLEPLTSDISFDDIPETQHVTDQPGNGAVALSPKLGTIALCCPTDRDFPPVTFECLSVLMRNHQMPLVLKAETLLVRGRNLIVERFLSTKCQWSFWVDSDMLLPFGNAQWFKDKSKIDNLRPEQYGFDALKRLLSHRQDFVGAVYAARSESSQLIIQPDIDPRTPADTLLADQIRKNQSHGLKDVAWLGFGCCLVHRRVFEAVGRTDPEIRQGKASFFDTQGAKGEDIRFSERAAVAGFRPKLDAELFCGHLGRKCFRPQDTIGRATAKA